MRGILGSAFEDYRDHIASELKKAGLRGRLAACQRFALRCFANPALRAVFVAIKKEKADRFTWPVRRKRKPLTVGGDVFTYLMSARKWNGARAWRDGASGIAPAIVGGSKKHGGPDLGPTRAKEAWAALGVNGHLIAAEPPERDFVAAPHDGENGSQTTGVSRQLGDCRTENPSVPAGW